jgi:hypothetical protein
MRELHAPRRLHGTADMSTLEEAADDVRADLIATLEELLSDVRNGRVIAVACVAISEAQSYDPWWMTSDPCIHAGAVLRAAVSWLATRMDADALRNHMRTERERDPHLS